MLPLSLLKTSQGHPMVGDFFPMLNCSTNASQSPKGTRFSRVSSPIDRSPSRNPTIKQTTDQPPHIFFPTILSFFALLLKAGGTEERRDLQRPPRFVRYVDERAFEGGYLYRQRRGPVLADGDMLRAREHDQIHLRTGRSHRFGGGGEREERKSGCESRARNRRARPGTRRTGRGAGRRPWQWGFRRPRQGRRQGRGQGGRPRRAGRSRWKIMTPFFWPGAARF